VPAGHHNLHRSDEQLSDRGSASGQDQACVAGQVPLLTAAGTAIINGSTIEMTPFRKSIHED
jgi:hypothetical protein